MSSDTYFDSFDIFCSKGFNDRTNTVVSSLAACFAESDFPKFHIDVIGDDDNILREDLVEMSTRSDAFSGEIHVGLRFQEDTFCSTEDTRCVESLVSFFPFQKSPNFIQFFSPLS